MYHFYKGDSVLDGGALIRMTKKTCLFSCVIRISLTFVMGWRRRLTMDYIWDLQDTIIQNTDSRAAQLSLMQSPTPTMLILLSYCLMVYYGPKCMENRKPVNLQKTLIVYNLVMVIFSGYICLECLILIFTNGNGIICSESSYDSTLTPRMIRAQWLYFMSKMIELVDTLFFVLRKKNNQITVLHIFHHVIMAFSWHWVVRFMPDHNAVLFLPMLNSLVHVIMYAYYCLSALGPRIQPYLWWKKYLTRIQLIQFACILFHVLHGLYFTDRGCKVSSFAMVYCMFITSIVAVLFINFYYQCYIKKDKKLK